MTYEEILEACRREAELVVTHARNNLERAKARRAARICELRQKVQLIWVKIKSDGDPGFEGKLFQTGPSLIVN